MSAKDLFLTRREGMTFLRSFCQTLLAFCFFWIQHLQHMLQMLDPKEAERQKRLAEGPQKGHSFTPREEQILRAHGYSLPGEG